MTFEEMKHLLLEYPRMTETVYKINKEIEDIKEAVKALRHVEAIVIDGMPHSSMISDDTYHKAQKVVDEYNKRLQQLLERIESEYEKQREITDLIVALTPDERKIIEARYLLGIRWDYIPAKVYMSRRECFYKHDAAINKMINKI